MMMHTKRAGSAKAGSAIEIRPARVHAPLLAAAGAAVGAIVGALVSRLAGWASALEWAPAQDLLRLIARLVADHDWLTVAIPLALATLGAIGGFWAFGQTAWVRVSGREVEVVSGSRKQRYARSQVGAVVIDGKDLVLRDHADTDLARHRLEVSAADVRAALLRRSWPDARHEEDHRHVDGAAGA